MEVFYPSGENKKAEIAAIGAHQDDIEIMAFSAIKQYGGSFSAIVLSDGAGSPLKGKYEGLRKEELIKLRRNEQIEAAKRGNYASLYMLFEPSSNLKKVDRSVAEKLAAILSEIKPKELYIHSPFDKHPTHIGAMKVSLEAIKLLPKEIKPEKLYGCEVWRGLDWMEGDEDLKVIHFDDEVGLSDYILSSFSSQNESKNYLDAAKGRRKSNATFSESHSVNQAGEAALYVDLSVFLRENPPSPEDFVAAKIDAFKKRTIEILTQ